MNRGTMIAAYAVDIIGWVVGLNLLAWGSGAPFPWIVGTAVFSSIWGAFWFELRKQLREEDRKP